MTSNILNNETGLLKNEAIFRLIHRLFMPLERVRTALETCSPRLGTMPSTPCRSPHLSGFSYCGMIVSTGCPQPDRGCSESIPGENWCKQFIRFILLFGVDNSVYDINGIYYIPSLHPFVSIFLYILYKIGHSFKIGCSVPFLFFVFEFLALFRVRYLHGRFQRV